MSATVAARGESVQRGKHPVLSVTIGRFQPWHLGHQSILRAALREADELLVLIGSSGQARSYRNPFTFTERKAMILNSLHAEEVGRVTVLPISDFPYNDEKWFTSVQAAIAGHCAAKGIKVSRSTVVLAGHAKDGTSYYIKRFPQYGALRLPNHAGLSATDLREPLFSDRHKAAAWLHTEGRRCLPSTVVDFLDRFMQTPDYAELVAEYDFIRDYKAKWDRAPFPPTFNTVDSVVIQSGHVLMVRRKDFPGRGLWALPGGFLNQAEELLDAAIRETREETKLKVPAKVLRGSIKAERTFAYPYRSARGRTITHAFLMHLPPDELPDVRGASDAKEAAWRPIAEVRENECMEDHFHILHTMLALIRD